MIDPAELARRCEPPEGTEPGTWHWLEYRPSSTKMVAQWIPSGSWQFHDMVWKCGSNVWSTDALHGYRYLAPCLSPDAAALIETQAREIAEARAAIVELMMTFAIMGLSNKIDPRHLPAIRRAQEEPPP